MNTSLMQNAFQLFVKDFNMHISQGMNCNIIYIITPTFF